MSWPALKRSSFATFAIVQSLPKIRPNVCCGSSGASMLLDDPTVDRRQGTRYYDRSNEAAVRLPAGMLGAAGADSGGHGDECVRFRAHRRCDSAPPTIR